MDCLAAAKGLEHLHLQTNENDWDQTEPPFTNIFINTWPNLSHLSWGLELDYKLFAAFCSRHRESLRSLRIRYSYLFGGFWKDLIEEIREFLHLTDAWLEDLVDLSGTWESGYRPGRLPEAEHYLLLGGDNPFKNGILTLEEDRLS